MTPTQQELVAAHKARLVRFAQAGRASFDHDIVLRSPVSRPAAVLHVKVAEVRQPEPPPQSAPLPEPTRITLPNNSPARLPLKIATIQGIVCEKFGIPRALMTGPGRTRPIVRPRQIAMFLTQEFLPAMSLNMIGQKFGGKDHTTTLHGIKTIGSMLNSDPMLADIVDELRETIRRVAA